MLQIRFSRLLLPALAPLLLSACELGRGFGGSDLVVSSTTYFSPPEVTRFPFDTPFKPMSRSPIESAGPGMIRFNGLEYRHISTRSDRVLARGVYRAPLPLHVYQQVVGGTPLDCSRGDNVCRRWLVLFEATVISDGEYSSLSPRRVSIDQDLGHCVLSLLVAGDEAEARAAIEQTSKSDRVNGITWDCERAPLDGVYDPKTQIFTPDAR